MVNQVAIIPARGGSKRIEKKNIIDFCGKPMIAWTIEAAIKSNKFKHVVVSTDDMEIAEIAKQYGAFIPFLRKKYADDHSPVSMATYGTLQQIYEETGERYDVVVQLMANCPLRTADHINSALNNFYQKNLNSQISCFKFGWMNPWWAASMDETGFPKPIFPEIVNQRSQDLPILYCPTGATWIAKTAILEKYQTFHIENKAFHEIPWEAAIDIDDYDDLKMAKLLYKMHDYEAV